MNAQRKVFVASKSTQDNINETFKWPDGFERADNLEDAEFIVLDLGNLPDEWPTYPWKKPDFYIPTQNVPVFFVALGDNIDPQFDAIKKLFKSATPPVYKTPAELFDMLEWLQSMFPFYNQKRIPSDIDKFDKATAYAVLSTLKANLNL